MLDMVCCSHEQVLWLLCFFLYRHFGWWERDVCPCGMGCMQLISTLTKCDVQVFLIKPIISYPLTIFVWKTVVATGNHDIPVNPFVWSWLTQDWVLLLFLYILIPSESSKQEVWKPLYTKAVPVVYFFAVLAQRSINSIILISKEAQLNSFSLQFNERTFSFS